MSYSKITNPLDRKQYSIFNSKGKHVLRRYIKQMKFKKGGSLEDLSRDEYTLLTKMNTILKGYNYNYLKYLGKGGYGIVAKYEKDGKIYAIKSGKRKIKDIKTKVLNKYIADTITKLKDPNNKFNCNFVLQYKVLETVDRDFLISEVLDLDLFDYISDILYELTSQQNFKEKFNIIKYLICQLIYAINCLHSIGITHGDLKPENIFIKYDSKGMPKIKIADIDGGKIDKQQLDAYFEENNLPEEYKELFNQIDGFTLPYISYNMRTIARSQGTSVKKIIEKSTDIYSIGIIIYMLFKLEFPSREINTLTNIQKGIFDRYTTWYMQEMNKYNEKNLSDFYFGRNKNPEDSILLSLLADNPSERVTAKQLYRNPLIKEMCEEVKLYFSNNETSGSAVETSGSVVETQEEQIKRLQEEKNKCDEEKVKLENEKSILQNELDELNRYKNNSISLPPSISPLVIRKTTTKNV